MRKPRQLESKNPTTLVVGAVKGKEYSQFRDLIMTNQFVRAVKEYFTINPNASMQESKFAVAVAKRYISTHESF